MDVTIRRGLNETFLVLPAGEINEVAYRILSENPGTHLMRTSMASETECAFSVNGGSILQNKYGRGGMRLTVIRKLFFDLERAVHECEARFMSPDSILLNPQVIIEKDDGGFFFAAHPGMKEDLSRSIRRLTHFCSENWSGDDKEREIMNRLTEKVSEDLFAFDDLLFILGDTAGGTKRPSGNDAAVPETVRKKDSLLPPVLLLVFSAVFLSLYLAGPVSGEPRLLLASFVLLASSAAFTILRIMGRKKE